MSILRRMRRLWRGNTTLPAITAQAEPVEVRSLLPQDIIPGAWSNKPKWEPWDTNKAIQDGLKASTWVYTCVSKNAKSVAAIPWFVERRTKDGWERDESDSNGLVKLLKQPNEAWDWATLMNVMVQQVLLGGNTLIAKSRIGRVPVELWPIGPHGVSPVPGGPGQPFISGYEYRNQESKKFTLKAEDSIHILLPDPGNPYWGLSPLMAGAKAVNTDVSAANWQQTSLQNMMVPPGVFTFEKTLSSKQVEEAHERIQEKYAGAVHARKPLVVGAGAKWVQLSLNPKELDFLNSRKLTREEICAIFGVPPQLVGIMDRSSFNNYATAERVYLEHTVLPMAEKLRDAFNRMLAVEFKGEFRFALDLSRVVALLTRLAEKIALAKDLWSMGVPFNELDKRFELGIGPVAGGDVGYLPSTVVPAEGYVGEDF